MAVLSRPLTLLGLLSVATAVWVDLSTLDACPGYKATNVNSYESTLTADLSLAGKACNVFGTDIQQLKLEVTYETDTRIHVKVIDPAVKRYEVPESVVPRPSAKPTKAREIEFKYTAEPFSFSILRTQSNEVLFSTEGHPIIFEPQYIRVKTSLPPNPNIYGLGEHTDSFRLPTNNYTRTLWSRDSYGVPNNTNLYGNHPIYFEHRPTGSHGVFLLNSNGMDIKINQDSGASAASLEYNVIGGVIDFYFLAGSISDPIEVARQYAQVVGTPAEVPYWSFGFHQCRFGYKDYVDVAGVIKKYSEAGIPLETMWTDIDYMDKRRVFTLDSDYFPLKRMREIIDYLHAHNQQYILMTDPAVAYLPNSNYGPYDHGKEAEIWLKAENGSDFLGVVWPGVTVYPDWFDPKAQGYWTGEFERFYNPKTGLDIDGSWIDMNEPASFCTYPCDDPFKQAKDQGLPPVRHYPPPDPNTPIFQDRTSRKRQHAGDNLLNPPYAIQNALPYLSDRTAYANTKHANALVSYDTHNLYGTLMSTATRNALLARRPGKRPLIITRSTFAGAGKDVGKWLGDNFSLWEHYRNSISGILGFASVYQVPMVGADICGFGANTTETLCARWASLGAFYPFMRNHNGDTSISQEFYIWESVTKSAKNALDIRYRLLDYLFTAFHKAHLDGTPVLHPLWHIFPKDPATYGIDLQFFFGDSILVSPVTQENVTSVTAYLPKETFYDFKTYDKIEGQGQNVTWENIDYTQIPVHIRGGSILPLRASGAMTTAVLRKTDFEILVAIGADGKATGSLYVDDGVSLDPQASTQVSFEYDSGILNAKGSFEYPLGVKVSIIRFLGVQKAPKRVLVNKKEAKVVGGQKEGVVLVNPDLPFTSDFTVELQD
ncbi:alpha-glucosidase [Thelephora ganbajun]|uniref:Alpha-glucosidase n=1 Tax=Thelephora ganbajun TaxID=370292 RepID=A0ACB6ZB52_THEGA|nr:alpha-glucosidase [Thelephora ganbajun]